MLKLELQQAAELLAKSVVFTDQFKTAETWGFQPILLPPIATEFLKFQLEKVRPLLERINPSSRNVTAPMFCPWTILPVGPNTEVRFNVKTWARRNLGILLTTNTLRGLMETTSSQMVRDRLITQETREVYIFSRFFLCKNIKSEHGCLHSQNVLGGPWNKRPFFDHE